MIVTGWNEKPGSRTHTLANPHLEAGNTSGRYSQGHQLPSPYQEPQIVTDIALSLPETALHGPSGPQNSAPPHPLEVSLHANRPLQQISLNLPGVSCPDKGHVFFSLSLGACIFDLFSVETRKKKKKKTSIPFPSISVVRFICSQPIL